MIYTIQNLIIQNSLKNLINYKYKKVKKKNNHYLKLKHLKDIVQFYFKKEMELLQELLHSHLETL